MPVHLRDKVSREKKNFAKKLRANQTAMEILLWSRLQKRRLGSLRWKRQSVIRGYIMDFYCPSKKIAVEVDGMGHDAAKDRIRDGNIFRDTGIRTLRFSNTDVKNHLSQVLGTIAVECGIPTFPIFPQRQQLQDTNTSISPCCDDESCENVENPPRSQEREDLALAKLCGPNVNRVDFGVREIKGCRRQVFSTKEVAEATARSLAKIGIKGFVERCSVCGLIHLREDRKGSK